MGVTFTLHRVEIVTQENGHIVYLDRFILMPIFLTIQDPSHHTRVTLPPTLLE